MSTMAQFASVMAAGEFPPQWANSFTVYGFPLPLIAHQFTSFLGAFFVLLTRNVVVSYTIVSIIATLTALIFFYRFIRFHVKPEAALLATIFFGLAPYRIMNLYTRGALPEYFAVSWILLILVGMGRFARGSRSAGILAISIGMGFLLLTHPMMAVTGALLLGAYGLQMLITRRVTFASGVRMSISALIGAGLSSYFILPLFAEMRYFVYGIQDSHLRPGGALRFVELLSSQWFYFGTSHPGPPGEVIKIGIIEGAIIICALAVALVPTLSHTRKKFIMFWLALAGVMLFLISPAALPLYEHISLLSNLQYPWRWLSVFVLIPPILLALLYDEHGTPALFILFLLCIGWSRIPVLYGKNYTAYETTQYYSNRENLHTANMHTLWMGNPLEYRVRTSQADIFDGVGSIQTNTVENSYRSYTVDAKTPVKVVDYTFFFPGWIVRVDGQETPIEFQNPNFRGVITYSVPAGKHDVSVRFVRTRTRKLAYLLTAASAGLLCLWVGGNIFWERRQKKRVTHL